MEKKLTLNQIILLFEIKRGTEEMQQKIGTYNQDLLLLLRRRFIRPCKHGLMSLETGKYELTDEGDEIVIDAYSVINKVVANID